VTQTLVSLQAHGDEHGHHASETAELASTRLTFRAARRRR
jgi:hypothetical protein